MAAKLTDTFTVTCSGSWNITGASSWLTVSPSSGSGTKTVTVTASINDGTDSRECTLTVTSATGNTATVKITQKGYVSA